MWLDGRSSVEYRECRGIAVFRFRMRSAAKWTTGPNLTGGGTPFYKSPEEAAIALEQWFTKDAPPVSI